MTTLSFQQFSAEFHETFESLDKELIFTCALASASVYEDNPSKAFKSSTKSYTVTKAASSNEEICSQKYVVVEAKGIDGCDVLLVAFSGGQNWTDILTDVTILPTLCPFEGLFHMGLMNKAENIPVEPFIRLLVQRKSCLSNFKLIFTGHSLGGSIASIVAAKLMFHAGVSTEMRECIRCVTFGSPTLADCGFANFLEKQNVEHKFEHFVIQDDMVPCLFTLSSAALQNFKAKKEESNYRKLITDIFTAFSPLFGVDSNTINTGIFQTIWRYIKLKKKDEKEEEEIFKNLWSTLEPLIKVVFPSYVPFGVTCFLVYTEETIYDKVSMDEGGFQEVRRIERKWNIDRKRTKDASNTFNSLICPWDSFSGLLQKHKMTNYIQTLVHFVDTCSQNQEVQNSCPFSQDSLKVDDICVMYCEIQTVYHFNISVTTPWPEQICIKSSAVTYRKAQISDNLAIFEFEMCKDDISKFFQFNTHCLEIEVIPYFGNALKVKFSKDYWKKFDINYSSTQYRVSRLSLNELYTSALGIAFQTGPRNPMQVIKNASPSCSSPKETEIKYPSGSITSTHGTKIYEREIPIKKQSLKSFHFEEPLPETVLPSETMNIDILRYVLKLSSIWSHAKAKSYTMDEIEDFWTAYLGESIDASTQRNLIFKTKAMKLRHLISILHNDNSITITQILVYALPLILDWTSEMLTFNIQRNMSTTNKLLLIAGTAGFLAVGPMVALAGLYGSAALTGFLSLGMIGGSVIREYDARYDQWLDHFLFALNINPKSVHNSLFAKEKRIFEESENRVINTGYVSQNILSMSEKDALSQWDHIFLKDTEIQLFNHDSRKHAFAFLQTVWCNYKIRMALSYKFSVGVIGESKAGKTTLVKRLFGIGNPTNAERTVDMQMIDVTERFRIIDFPHIDGVSDVYKECFSIGRNLVDAVIVVMEASKMNGDIKDGHLRIIDFVKKLKIPFLICMNQVDMLIFPRNEVYEEEEGKGDDDDDDDDDDEEEEANIWNAQRLRQTKQVVGRCFGFKPQEIQESMMWTSFRTKKMTPQDKQIHEMCKSEINSLEDCKEWMLKQASDSVPDIEIAQIRDFKPVLTKKKKKVSSK